MDTPQEVTSDGEAALKLGTGIPSPFQLLARYGVLVVGGLYTAGLLIVNLDLGRYGLISLNLARPEYMIAGGLWVFLTVIMWLASVVLVRNAKHLFSSRRRAPAFLLSFFEFMISLGFCWWVIYILSRNQIGPTHRKGWFVFIVVLLNSLVLGLGLESYRELFKAGPISLRRFTAATEGKGSLIYFAVSQLILLVFYSLVAFPQFPREFGGGRKTSVHIFLKESHQIPWQDFLLPLSSDHKRLGPVALLLETNSTIVITRLEDPLTGSWYSLDTTTPAVGIDKKIVAAVVYKAGAK